MDVQVPAILPPQQLQPMQPPQQQQQAMAALPAPTKNSKKKSKRNSGSNFGNGQVGAREDAICPNPSTYLPFAHAGQSTPQMRTLHKIVWVLQHQKKALAVDAIRSCLPGKKKAQIKEIDYLLTSYESYKYTKSEMVSGRKKWELCADAFPAEFWNMHWQRTH